MMHGAGVAVVASLVLMAGTASAAAAQRDARPEPAWLLEAGVAFSSPLLVDGNGTRVRLAPAALIGAALARPSWGAGEVAFAVDARLSSATVRLEDDGARWKGGRAWQAELVASGRLTRWERVTPRVGAGATWIGGSGDVEVVREIARRPRPLVEGGVELRRHAGSRTALSLAAQGIPVSPAGGDAGGVLRVLVTVRHGW